VPVVSGVGHETDFTIADFVADRRAPTPSAAAEIVSPDREELKIRLRTTVASMAVDVRGRLDETRRVLAQQLERLRLASPTAQLANARQRVDDLQRRLAGELSHDLALKLAGVARLKATLEAVGPPAVLARGYALVTRQPDAALVRSAADVVPGDSIWVRVQDGSFGAEVSGGHEPVGQSE
jgi:exodeoxyribonuclease VII large subunit